LILDKFESGCEFSECPGGHLRVFGRVFVIMVRFLPPVAASFLAFTLAGCATVTRGTTSDVEFVSEPPGAVATTSLGSSCTTPCSLRFSRKEEFSVVFRLAGHADETVEVKSRLGGAGAAGLAGNVILGGVVGIVADAASGATLEHAPNPVSVVLKKLAPSAPPTNRSRPPRRPARPPAPQAELSGPTAKQG